MRIGIQILSLRPGRVGGQGIFVRRLLSQVPRLLDDDRLVIFLRPELAREEVFQSLGQDARIELCAADPEPHHGPNYGRWNLKLLDAARLDVVFFPLSFFFPRPLPLPVVLHVPDVQHEYFPHYFSEEQLAWRRERIPASVQLADAVITYSRCSAAGLIEHCGAAPERTHIIPAAGFTAEELSAARVAAPREAATTPWHGCGFLLYPAADWPHKNHEMLLAALAELAARGRREHLVLTGILSEREAELRALARRLGVAPRVHFLGCVPSDRLVGLYQAAALLVFPSRFEGFGLPLVEAMQLGCPIVASRAAGVLETIGSGAVTCEDQPGAWAEQIDRVLSDAALRQRLIRRGAARGAWFDWGRVAAAHLALWRAAGHGDLRGGARKAVAVGV